MKYRNVTCITVLCELPAQCNSPAPVVDLASRISRNCSTQSGRVAKGALTARRCIGCATKVDGSREQQEFMGPTSPLHWYIRKDVHGKVLLQSKLTCDDKQWSEQHYPWTPNAPRPGNRTFKEGTCGLRPSDIAMCAQKKPTDTRKAELAASLPPIQERVTAGEWEEVKQILDTLVTDMHLEDRTVPNAGLFMNENDDPMQQGGAQPADEEQHMFLAASLKTPTAKPLTGKIARKEGGQPVSCSSETTWLLQGITWRRCHKLIGTIFGLARSYLWTMMTARWKSCTTTLVRRGAWCQIRRSTAYGPVLVGGSG